MVWNTACTARRRDPKPGLQVANIRTLINPNAREMLDGPYPDRTPLRFHRRLPGYEETPLVDAQKLASALGVGKVFVKDESSRLGLPAFKVLGASWAVTGPWRSVLGRISGTGRRSGSSRSISNPRCRSRSWRPPTAIMGAPWRGWRDY